MSIDNRTSRVVLALGNEALSKMKDFSVGVIGLSPTSTEAIKNLVLTGVETIEVKDSKEITNFDLGSNFFVRESDLAEQRIDKILPRLSDLNPNCKLTGNAEPVTDEWLLRFKSIILGELRPFSEISHISELCHTHGIQFIFAASIGPNGVLFEDFGDSFICNNTNGQAPLVIHVSNIRRNKESTIVFADKSDEDVKIPPNRKIPVRFEGFDNFPAINGQTAQIIKQNKPGWFAIDLDISQLARFGQSQQFTGKMVEIIHPYEVKHKEFKETLANPVSNMSPFPPTLTPIKDMFIAFAKFWDEKHRPPRLLNKEDSDVICSTFQTKNDEQVKKSAMLYPTEYPPMAGMVGGIASMECLKYITGIFSPTKTQWTVIDRCTAITWKIDNLPILDNSRYDVITATTGNQIQQKIRTLSVLIAGIGAIGCEYARYAALFGFNRIALIDNDTIELSNLTRQFLFRTEDRGRPKAFVARERILQVNSDLQPENVTSYQEKFEDRTALSVGRNFDIIFSAVDSNSARNYISDYSASRCIPMVNAGMLSYKSNFEVYVPFKTKKPIFDETEGQYASCTLKNQPTKPIHLLQWSQEEFIKFYQKQPEFALECLKQADVKSIMQMILNKGVKFLNTMPVTFQDCVQWALNRFRHLIELRPQLISQREGNTQLKFVKFDIHKKWHKEFLLAASQLKANLHHISYSQDEINNIESIYSNCFNQKDSLQKDSNEKIVNCQELRDKLRSIDPTKITFTPIHFDKDNELDIKFVESFAKSRAEVHSIPMDMSTLQIMQSIGSIAPTLASTTAYAGAAPISGLSLLFSNENDHPKMLDGGISFIGLQTLFFGCQMPPPRRYFVGATKNKFGPWDFIDVKDNPTLTELKERMDQELNGDVNWVCGSICIDIDDSNKDKRIVDVLKELVGYNNDIYVIRQFCYSNDENMDELDSPLLRIYNTEFA